VPSKWIVLPVRHRRRESIAIVIKFTESAIERLLPGRRDTAEIMMWVWVIGAFSLAAVVNQIAIALCRRAQATEPDLHEQSSPELQSRR
jgi:hypothetical protein